MVISLYDILHCYAKTMNLAILSELRLVWKGTLNLGMKGFIYFLYARRIVKKGCFSYLAYVPDTSIASPPPMDAIQVVRAFMDVFP